MESAVARKVVVSSFQVGALSAFDSAFEGIGEALAGAPNVRVDRVLFGALLQSGAEHFELGPGPTSLWQSSFLNNRMSPINVTEYDELKALVESLFSEHLPAGWKHDFGQSYSWPAANFLTDLLFGLHRRAGVVLMMEPSEIEAEKLPPELLQLVKNIVSSIAWVEATHPVPIGSVSGESAGTLLKIVESDLFRRYSATHERLEVRSEDHRTLLEELGGWSADLVRRFRDSISLRRSALGLFSGASGAFSSGHKSSEPWMRLAAVLGDSGVWQQRRIAIYRCGPMLRDLYLKTLKHSLAEDEERKGVGET